MNKVEQQHSTPVAIKMENLVRWLVLLAFSAFCTGGLLYSYPFSGFAVHSAEVFGIFRIVFGLLLLVRLWRSRRALPMLWGYEKCRDIQRIWGLWGVVGICLTLGIGGVLPLLANMLLFVLVFYRSRYYSIEEIYFQLTSFFLLLMPVTGSFALDSLIGTSDWWWRTDRLSAAALVLWLNAYAWCLALLLLSAAMEKLLCSSWRSGLSFYYFIGLPHLLKRPFRFLRRHRWFCLFASYATVVGQGGLFVSYAVGGLAPAFWLKHFLFGILLFTIFDLSFIGQIFCLQFALLLALYFTQDGSGVAFAADYTKAIFAAGVIVLVLLTAVRVLLPDALNALSRGRKMLFALIKGTSGLVPIKVFNDAHLFGLYLYQVRDQAGHNCLPAFADDGAPAELQTWTPRYFQGAMYPVTDACLARRYFPHLKDFRLDRIHDLFFAASRVSAASPNFSLWVKAINPTGDYSPTTEHWLDAVWTEVYRGQVSDDKVTGEWVAEPPPVNRITRVLS